MTKTGRTPAEVEAFAAYFKAQELFGTPEAGSIDYSQTLEFDLTAWSRAWRDRSGRRTESILPK